MCACMEMCVLVTLQTKVLNVSSFAIFHAMYFIYTFRMKRKFHDTTHNKEIEMLRAVEIHCFVNSLYVLCCFHGVRMQFIYTIELNVAT